MEFKKKVMITLYVRQQKRHRCSEQSFGLCGRGRGRNLHGDPLRSKMLQAPGSTQTAARPARARSSTSRAPPWPRPLHPHHTQVTPSTPRAPPQPRPPRPQLLPTRPGRPPYSTWAPPHTRPGLPGSGWRRGLSTLVLWTGLT